MLWGAEEEHIGIEQGNKVNRANVYSNTQLGDSFKNLTKDDK